MNAYPAARTLSNSESFGLRQICISLGVLALLQLKLGPVARALVLKVLIAAASTQIMSRELVALFLSCRNKMLTLFFMDATAGTINLLMAQRLIGSAISRMIALNIRLEP